MEQPPADAEPAYANEEAQEYVQDLMDKASAVSITHHSQSNNCWHSQSAGQMEEEEEEEY